jgi:hypothetical protein
VATSITDLENIELLAQAQFTTCILEIRKMTSADHKIELPSEEITSPGTALNPQGQGNGEGLRNFFKNPFNGRRNRQPTFFGHLLITSSLLALIGASNLLHNRYADQQAKKWLNSTEELTTLDGDNGKLGASATETARLIEQLNDIQSRLDRYSAMMIFFYKHYYTSIGITSASALVAGICLFFISKVGWQRVNNSLINVFVVTSSTVIFFGDLPGTFKYKENSEASRDLYLKHISLRNEVRSYLATGGTLSDNSENSSVYKRTEPNLFIHYIDQKLALLNEIPLGFDTTGINDFKNNAERLSIPEKTQSSR